MVDRVRTRRQSMVSVGLAVACAVLASMLGAGCTAEPAVVTGADDGSTVAVAAGDEVSVTLDSNPTTGYSWQVVGFDDAVARQVGPAVFESGTDDQDLVGTGGAETFTFETREPGTCEIAFEYRRPWEADVPPTGDTASEFSFTLVVEEP